MKFIEHSINKDNKFIMGWYAQDTSFCDELIDWFQKDPNNIKQEGGFSVGEDFIVDKSTKDSIDATFLPKTLNWLMYGNILNQCSELYKTKYQYSKCSGFSVKSSFNVQWYPIGGGYKQWHCERPIKQEPIGGRHLVFMTYLNNVEDGGTEFYYQNLTIKAEKGLTLIWPADWTFTHKGQISPTKEKYIVTGWFEMDR